jgi:hypothetical protein
MICPLPPERVLVDTAYLYDGEHKGWVDGIWVSVKSIPGEAHRFETYLPEYGALYDKLPISAFAWKEPTDPLPLDVLQIWNAMSYYVWHVDKPFLSGLRAEFFGKDKNLYPGVYVWTLDHAHPDRRIPDFDFSETPDEHKSFNLLRLDNGQFALQPNNRCRFFEPSTNPTVLKQPDFKVCTKTFNVEQSAKWRLGDSERFDYE